MGAKYGLASAATLSDKASNELIAAAIKGWKGEIASNSRASAPCRRRGAR